MLSKTVFKHFGSPLHAARALGITKSAVYQWGEVVPYASAKRLTEIAPVLTIDPSLYDERLRPKSISGSAA